MLYSQSTCYVGQFLQFSLCQQLFAFEHFRMETRLGNISKATNATEFVKTILESSNKVLLGPCILMIL